LPASHAFRIRLRQRRDLRTSDPERAEISLLAFSCRLQRVVSAAQAPSVRRVELGVRCVLSFLLVIREHAVLRRSLCATLTALIDPLAAPSGAIADGLTPCPVSRAEVMWIGLLGLRFDRSGVQGLDPDAQRVQVRHRSGSIVRRDLSGAHSARKPLMAKLFRVARGSARNSCAGPILLDEVSAAESPIRPSKIALLRQRMCSSPIRNPPKADTEQ
jgi:hypothetical protein